jgi:hypothetical protein
MILQSGSTQNSNRSNTDDDLLQILMKANPALFNPILDNKDSLRVQIIYTQINRDKRNRPAL